MSWLTLVTSNKTVLHALSVVFKGGKAMTIKRLGDSFQTLFMALRKKKE